MNELAQKNVEAPASGERPADPQLYCPHHRIGVLADQRAGYHARCKDCGFMGPSNSRPEGARHGLLTKASRIREEVLARPPDTTTRPPRDGDAENHSKEEELEKEEEAVPSGRMLQPVRPSASPDRSAPGGPAGSPSRPWYPSPASRIGRRLP